MGDEAKQVLAAWLRERDRANADEDLALHGEELEHAAREAEVDFDREPASESSPAGDHPKKEQQQQDPEDVGHHRPPDRVSATRFNFERSQDY